MTSQEVLELVQLSRNGPLDPADLVQRLGAGDPQLALLAQMLGQRAHSGAEPAASEERLEIDRLQAERRADAECVARVQRGASELVEEVERLRTFVGELAAALGACPSCWGSEQSCRYCRGRGRPGCMPPDAAPFERWVLPALAACAREHRFASPERTVKEGNVS